MPFGLIPILDSFLYIDLTKVCTKYLFCPRTRSVLTKISVLFSLARELIFGFLGIWCKMTWHFSDTFDNYRKIFRNVISFGFQHEPRLVFITQFSWCVQKLKKLQAPARYNIPSVLLSFSLDFHPFGILLTTVHYFLPLKHPLLAQIKKSNTVMVGASLLSFFWRDPLFFNGLTVCLWLLYKSIYKNSYIIIFFQEEVLTRNTDTIWNLSYLYGTSNTMQQMQSYMRSLLQDYTMWPSAVCDMWIDRDPKRNKGRDSQV